MRNKAKNKGHFKPGHTASVGNDGGQRHRILTGILIQQLNEVDKSTGRAKMHKMIEKLLDLAIGYEYEEEYINHAGKKKTRTVRVKADREAIMAVFDRVEGKAKTSEGGGDGPGSVTLVFGKDTAKLM